MRIVSAHKAWAAILSALVVVALCAGTAMAVTNHVNSTNAAAQRAAAAQQARRRAAAHKQQHMEWLIQQARHEAQQARREAQQARREAANRPSSPPVVVVPPAAPVQVAPSGLTDCGSGTQGEEVYAGSDTSCAFALNVESDYWATPGMDDTFTSYSPVTGQDYFMTAVDNGTTVTATNSTGALVEFSDGG